MKRVKIEEQESLKNSKEEAKRKKEDAAKIRVEKEQIVIDNMDATKKEICLHEKEKEARAALLIGENLIKEGNEKLTKAIQTNDFSRASLAQAMIEAAQRKCSEVRKGMECNSQSRRLFKK